MFVLVYLINNTRRIRHWNLLGKEYAGQKLENRENASMTKKKCGKQKIKKNGRYMGIQTNRIMGWWEDEDKGDNQ